MFGRGGRLGVQRDPSSSPRRALRVLFVRNCSEERCSHPLPPPYPSFLPPPGFLHTPDGGHLAPTLSRHSPPVFSAPWAGHRGGAAHPPGAYSHCAGKAAPTSSDKDSPLTPSLSSSSFVCDLLFFPPPRVIRGLCSCRASNFFIFSDFQLLSNSFLSGIQWRAITVILLGLLFLT